MHNYQGMDVYNTINRENKVASADPHELINLLFTAANDNLAQATQQLESNNIALKCTYLSKAFNIIDNLRFSLDMKNGGVIANNLDQLYDYMQKKIIDANLHNKTENIIEVINLLTTIQSGWQKIHLK